MSKQQVQLIKLERIAVRLKEAAALIGVSPRKFAEMRSCGLLPPSFKLGGCIVFKIDDLKDWARWGFPSLDRFKALQEAGAGR